MFNGVRDTDNIMFFNERQTVCVFANEKSKRHSTLADNWLAIGKEIIELTLN